MNDITITGDEILLPGVREPGQKSTNLNRVRSLVGDPVKWRNLRETILDSAPTQETNADGVRE